jgi:dUTP pyrophosphatase
VILAYRRLHAAARAPAAPRAGDAGYDLHAAESATLDPGGRASVGTGLALAVPEGQAGLVLPRSGLALRHGIALVNAPGLIDPAYRGEVRVLLLNTDRREPYVVQAGDRIAQLLLVPFALPPLREEEELGETARGPEGFGSTGR